MRCAVACLGIVLTLLMGSRAEAQTKANRFAYLDEIDPFHVGPGFPRWTTPQWFGEPGVEAVVIVSVESGDESVPRMEGYLRPILEKLSEKMGGKAPVSLMVEGRLDLRNPEVVSWLGQGARLESRGGGGEGPLLSGSFEEAARGYQGAIDRLIEAGGEPVAYRMPGVGQFNGASPRFFAEVFAERSEKGNFLRVDSSVYCVMGEEDRAFLPGAAYRNHVSDYPYPYQVGPICWEFPAIVPGDGQARKGEGIEPLERLKRSLDAVVAAQGVFTLALSTEEGIGLKDVLGLIDHAMETHGEKIRFVTFAEALARIDRFALSGQPMRDEFGRDNGVRLMDVNGDGYMDVTLADGGPRRTRIWNPALGQWDEVEFPTGVRRVEGAERPVAVRVGTFGAAGTPVIWGGDEDRPGLWSFEEGVWRARPEWLSGLPDADAAALRIRDVDGDGVCEVLIASAELIRQDANGVFFWEASEGVWKRRPFSLPRGAWLAGLLGMDHGTRLIDLNGDGRLDVVHANDQDYSISVFVSNEQGWGAALRRGRAGEPGALPAIAGPFGRNGGFWVKGGVLCWQNEQTGPMGRQIGFEEVMRQGVGGPP